MPPLTWLVAAIFAAVNDGSNWLLVNGAITDAHALPDEVLVREGYLLLFCAQRRRRQDDGVQITKDARARLALGEMCTHPGLPRFIKRVVMKVTQQL
jgi:hypothetical protein